jgi:hypothetical protein
MSGVNNSSGKPAHPPLGELFTDYLHKQMVAQQAGLASAEPTADVVPFDATPVQPVDPRLAWQESVAAVSYLNGKAEVSSLQAPPDWPGLVIAHEPVVALAFCVGNFPQLVRTFQPLLHVANLSKLRPVAGRPVAAPALVSWTAQVAQKKQFPQALLALGSLRMARQFDQAAELLKSLRSAVPTEWRSAWANEEAALTWHCGQAQEAVAMWQAQPESVPVLFNRGMAALFLDHPAEARSHLTQVIAQISEESAWHHLGRLYAALAETRR